MADKITRIAIVDDNRCKPKRCAQECKKVFMSRRENGQTLYRGEAYGQDRLHIRVPLHWLRYLRQEMPVRSHHHHQSSHKLRICRHPSLHRQFLQTSSSSYPATRSSARSRGD
ncbi:hypothetical protein EDB92DRAFT_1100278 [Lactarius akahatsu]|uniref:RNase L inhibitor RLI-like possible metal-binding domain-containing protein n=1 Tax=Lactarius akahatsu TaxID=416441 RepID=A0AAD4LGM4_9AGAM|nr:hypothetical protein EDB92DRAFT_1100278 [Lactarius akahatsu]